MTKKTLKDKIKEEEIRHKEINGFSIKECGYDNCIGKIKVEEYKRQLKQSLAKLGKEKK